MKFRGYRRKDDTVGIRNHVLVLPTVGCASETCRIITGLVDGSVSFVNQNGCGEVEGNLRLTQEVLTGLAVNPNIYGTILIGLGCELNSTESMAQLIAAKTDKPLHQLVIQQEGGTVKTIKGAVTMVRQMVSQAELCRTEDVELSELMLGIECGGSDATSGLGANPVMGCVSDRLIDSGGTVIFSETPEIIGAEHILANRCRSSHMGEKILGYCSKLEYDLESANEGLRSGQPSPGNKAGGISTLEEKSLGCIYKGGTHPISEVVDYARRPKQKGLIFMDTPGYDILSVTAKVAAGCQLILFTTGRGNPVGNPVAPVLKVTANHETYAHMSDNIDIDLSAVLGGGSAIEDMAHHVLEEIVKTASGSKTKAEIHGFGFSEILVRRICDYV
jgi:altronate dehydratase large subunit